MKTDIHQCPGYSVLRMEGDFETYSVSEFLEAVRTIKQPADRGPTRIVIDMSQVTFINSKGIGALLRTRKELGAAGGGLALARSSTFVRGILTTLDLDSVLRNYEEEDEAARALLAGDARMLPIKGR